MINSKEQFNKVSSLHRGDSPEQVPHDDGHGYKTEYPGLMCKHCSASFYRFDDRAAHAQALHGDSSYPTALKY